MARVEGPAVPWGRVSVLITSGPTREHLDPVRFLTNASSGRMGRALAAEALRLGARVTVVSGPAEVPPPPGAEAVPVETASEMLREVLSRRGRSDVIVGAAAVADWRFASPSRRKLKRGPGPVTLTLLPNPDIIKAAGAGRRPGARPRVVAGFALETGDPVPAARAKLAAKGLDLVVANEAASLGRDRARFALVTREGVRRLGSVSKRAAARRVLACIGALLARGGGL